MIVKTWVFPVYFTISTLISGAGLTACSAPPSSPNILLILADDLGYSDLGCYGGEIHTPNIDQLARKGIMFLRYYTSPMCVTTRVALFSGMEYMAAGRESFPNGISFPYLLRDAGYATSMVGKNHGMGNFRTGDPETDYGFDHFFGFSGGEINSFTGSGRAEWQMDGRIFPNTDLPQDFYTTNNFTDSAIVFMKEALADGKPFFSYVAYNAPHTPLHAPEKNVKRYYDPDKGINVYAEGWGKLREKRLTRMKEIGLVAGDVKLSDPGVEIPDWDLLPDTALNQWELQKKFECLTRSAFAGMVDNMDENVGKIISFLKDPNGDGNREDSQLDNTLIIFASDNGGCYAGLHSKREDVPWDKSTAAFTTNYGWGTLSNTPFRYYKHASHEGAIRSPLVIHWPEGLRLPAGTLLHQMVRVWDLYPTFLELAGIPYPQKRGEKPLKPLMGKSILPLFKDAGVGTEEYFVPLFSRARGMIRDHWKIANYFDGPFELYNLAEDPTERLDLAEKEPEKRDELISLLDHYTEAHGFTGDPSWDRPLGDTKRGWGYDFMRPGLVSTIPEFMSENVPADVKLRLEFNGKIDFGGTEGKQIRLQRYGDPAILWSADPDQNHSGQGKTTLVFNDFPHLEPGRHYYITWDAGWLKYEQNGLYKPILPIQESAFAFRFKTLE
jgi:arylsulfatase A-like enzyme